MGMLRDVLDTVRDIGTMGSIENVLRKRKYSSISKRSLEGTLQFPVLVSKSLDIDTAQTVSKALERQYASFVQIALTMSPTMNLDSDQDAIGYLKKFHQNSGVKTDMKDVFNTATNLMESHTVIVGESTLMMIAAVYEGSTGNLQKANKDQIEGILEHVRTDSLNNKFIPKKTYKFEDPNLSAHHNKIVREARGDAPYNGPLNFPQGASTTMDPADIRTNMQHRELGMQQRQNDEVNANNRRRNRLEEDKLSQGAGGRGNNGPKDVTLVARDLLKDNDVRKANELVPTTLHIRTVAVDADNQEQGYIDFVIGVKATLHPISSDEMVNNVIGACKNNSKFFNFVRWTSGEITFFKDFLFNVKSIKDDVVDRSSGASPWWITLKRRRAMAKMKDTLFLGNNILPNATIVMTQEEVEFIKSQYGFDLMNQTFIDKIMKQYFLIGFVVIDNSAQVAHFTFDGQSNIQSVTFAGMERENSSKSDLNEVLKIVNRAKMT